MTHLDEIIFLSVQMPNVEVEILLYLDFSLVAPGS